MKEIKQLTKDQVKEVRQKEEHAQQEKKVGHLKPQRGHTVFEYNTSTGDLKKAVFDHVDYDLQKDLEGIPQNKRITIQPNCVYVSALNIKNAIKKLAKYYNLTVKL